MAEKAEAPARRHGLAARTAAHAGSRRTRIAAVDADASKPADDAAPQPVVEATAEHGGETAMGDPGPGGEDEPAANETPRTIAAQ